MITFIFLSIDGPACPVSIIRLCLPGLVFFVS